jgi:hypothetical protein
VRVVCWPCNTIVPQELLRFGSFVHVSTASQATPTLPPHGEGEGSTEQSDNSKRPKSGAYTFLREILLLGASGMSRSAYSIVRSGHI